MRSWLEDERDCRWVIPGMNKVTGGVSLFRVSVNPTMALPAETYKVCEPKSYVTIRCTAHALRTAVVHVNGRCQAPQALAAIPGISQPASLIPCCRHTVTSFCAPSGVPGTWCTSYFYHHAQNSDHRSGSCFPCRKHSIKLRSDLPDNTRGKDELFVTHIRIGTDFIQPLLQLPDVHWSPVRERQAVGCLFLHTPPSRATQRGCRTPGARE